MIPESRKRNTSSDSQLEVAQKVRHTKYSLVEQINVLMVVLYYFSVTVTSLPATLNPGQAGMAPGDVMHVSPAGAKRTSVRSTCGVKSSHWTGHLPNPPSQLINTRKSYLKVSNDALSFFPSRALIFSPYQVMQLGERLSFGFGGRVRQLTHIKSRTERWCSVKYCTVNVLNVLWW